MTREDYLLNLRLRYDRAPIFTVEREALFAEIQEVEKGMDPDVIREIICRVIFEPELEPVQMGLDFAIAA